MNSNNQKKNNIKTPAVNKRNTASVKTDSRAKSLKIYSVGSVAILVAIVVLLNILISGLLGDALTFDFSANSQNTITKETREYIDSLPESTRIRIVGLLERPEDLQNTPYEYIVPLLDDYVAKSGGRITVEYKDPELYPSIISELDPDNVYSLEEGCYAIQYNGQIQVIDPMDCFTFDEDYFYFYNAYMPISNNVEYMFTNSIARLISGFSKKAYIITGLQEEYSNSITSILNALGCDVETITVSDSFDIPDDCDLLLLNGPDMDITEKVMLEIEDYLANGGKFICAVNFTDSNSSENYDNLNAVLNTMNINIDPYVIQENDARYMLDDSGYSSLTEVNESFIEQSSVFDYFYQFKESYIRPVRILVDSSTEYLTIAVSGTSENAVCIKVAESGVNQYGDAGRYYTGVYSTITGPGNYAQVIAFGSNDFMSDEYISTYGMNDYNVQFFKACCRFLLGNESNVVVNVQTRGISDYQLDGEKVTTTTSTAVLAVFMVTIPLIFLIASAVVYERRKNL